MKLWLFDILACPIDKFFPLELYIFSFENNQKEFLSLINLYKTRDLKIINNEDIIKIFEQNNKIYIKDNIITEKTNLKSYLKLILSSLNEFENVFDKTNGKLSKKCFKIMNSEVRTNLLAFLEKSNFHSIELIIPELVFINKIKLDFEIQSGILFCTKCKRWYPIIDTIPQMLPDKYREEKSEIEFLKNNRNLLDDEFFNQDIKPFKM